MADLVRIRDQRRLRVVAGATRSELMSYLDEERRSLDRTPTDRRDDRLTEAEYEDLWLYVWALLKRQRSRRSTGESGD
jgi:hypothetical protein